MRIGDQIFDCRWGKQNIGGNESSDGRMRRKWRQGESATRLTGGITSHMWDMSM